MTLILILLPLLFQIIFGRKAIGGDIKLRFGTICFISFLSQIILTIAAFNLTAYYLGKNNNACGMPFVGLTMLSLFFTFGLFLTMFIQDRIKKSYGEDEIDEIDEPEDENDKIEKDEYDEDWN